MSPDTPPADLRVPLLAIDDFALLPGTLVPFHVEDPGLVEAVSHSLATDRRIMVAAATRGGGRAIGAIGRIVSDRRYEDGRIDIFVHALERASASFPEGPDPRYSEDLRPLPDAPHHAATESADRLRAVASAFAFALRQAAYDAEADAISSVLSATRDASLLSNRLAAWVFEDFAPRQAFLETICPVARCEALIDAMGAGLLSLPTGDAALH
jgi:ATP-dependent Lon protease